MKKKLFIFIAIGILLIPFGVNAGSKKVLDDEYETKNFIETLDDEELEKEFTNYQESDDKITIYLFRGKGCSFCRAYLSFMNGIAEEYGKYFNMVSFEVWNNEDNWNLMQRISYYLDEEVAGGVPYIIIGDKVFPGFTESYGDDIKKAILDLYNTDKNDRYDVFKNVEKDGLITIDELKEIYAAEEEATATEDTYKTTSSSSKESNTPVILWNLLFVAVGTTIILVFNNYKLNQIRDELSNKNDSQKDYNKKKKRK